MNLQKTLLCLILGCSSLVYSSDSNVEPEKTNLTLEWKNIKSSNPQMELGGLLEIYASDFPLDKGSLNLTYSTALWENLSYKYKGRSLHERKVVNSNLDCRAWLKYEKYPNIRPAIRHTQPCLFYMPGEEITVKMSDNSNSWSIVAKKTPHPLACIKGNVEISAALVSIVPLQYKNSVCGVCKRRSSENFPKNAFSTSHYSDSFCKS